MSQPDPETFDVLECHSRFDLPIGTEGPKFFSDENLQKRVDFIQEEFDELQEAIEKKDLAKFVDGLIDMVYVIKGTAIMAGISPSIWREAWNAVHYANMAKVKSDTDNYHFGLIKPEGWTPPDIDGVLRKYKVNTL